MHKLLLAALFGFVATGAFAQDVDHDRYDHGYYRHDENPGRIVRHFFEGRSVGNCHTVVTRNYRPDGDVVVSRRRVCD